MGLDLGDVGVGLSGIFRFLRCWAGVFGDLLLIFRMLIRSRMGFLGCFGCS